MAGDTVVNQVQHVGTSTGGLLPAQAAIVYDSDFISVSVVPEGIVTGAGGGSVTGYYLVTKSPTFVTAIVTFDAVNDALAQADAPIDVNGAAITAGGLHIIDESQFDGVVILGDALYQAGALTGDGDMNVGPEWALYGAVSGTVSTRPLIRWEGATSTLKIGGSDGAHDVTNVAIDGATLLVLRLNSDAAIEITSAGVTIGGALANVGLYSATPVPQPARVGALTDLSGGGVTSNINDVGAIPSQATINNNFAAIVAKLNGIEAALSQASGGIGLTA